VLIQSLRQGKNFKIQVHTRRFAPPKIARIEFALPQSAQIKAPPLKSANFTPQTAVRNFAKISFSNLARDL